MKKYRKKTGVRRDRWKKNDAAAVAFVFLTVLGLLFYYLGMTRQRELERYDNRITLIRSDGNAYSCMEAEQMRIRNQEAEDPFSYALWGKEGIRQLQNRDLGRFAETEIYVVEGSSSLLFTSSVILDGTVEKSCLIGEDTAQALFGTDDATGLSITMDGSDYVVLGMLTEAERSAVFQAKDLNTNALDRINIQVSDDVTLSSLEQNLEGELGFEGTALDYRFITVLLGAAGFGLCFLLWIWLLRLLLEEFRIFRREFTENIEYYKNGHRSDPVYIKGVAIRIGGILGIVIILLIFLRFQVQIPEDLIPPKWSDFEFWERLINDKSERMLNWLRCEKGASELLYLEKSALAAVFLALSYLCYIVLRAINFGRNTRKRINKAGAAEKSAKHQIHIQAGEK